MKEKKGKKITGRRGVRPPGVLGGLVVGLLGLMFVDDEKNPKIFDGGAEVGGMNIRFFFFFNGGNLNETEKRKEGC